MSEKQFKKCTVFGKELQLHGFRKRINQRNGKTLHYLNSACRLCERADRMRRHKQLKKPRRGTYNYAVDLEIWNAFLYRKT